MDSKHLPEILDAERVGDRHRERYIDHLTAMMGEGRLSRAEAEARVGICLQACTEDDLRAVIADLPPVPVTVPNVATRRKGTGWGWFRVQVVGCILLATAGACLLIALPELLAVRPAGQHLGGPRGAAIAASIFAALGVFAAVVAWCTWLNNAWKRKNNAGHGTP